MAEQYFHLAIGPVQAFVAQARRTRDFWAGSFILSFLSSAAMLAVRQQGGEIQFPLPDEDYLSWLQGNADEGAQRPLQGSVPNRFKTMEVKVAEGFAPERVVAAVHQTWRSLADLVWQGDLQAVAGGDTKHKAIWDRQVENFWEISWCLTDDKKLSNLLDRRKNWRSHLVADEPGVKCSLMEGYQELSGQRTPGEGVREFWRSLGEQNEGLARDLREDEHLCAIAFVKRRFVHYFNRLSVQLPAGDNCPALELRGWPLPKTVPSIAYMAAMPWLAATAKAAVGNPEVALSLKKLEHALRGLDSPWEGRVANYIRQACEEAGYEGGKWQQVNGQYLFRPALDQSIKDARRSDSISAFELDALQDVAEHLKALRQLTGLGEPDPFYAILLMDGDSLGVQMGDANKQQGISQGLNDFTRGVPELIEKHSGFLVYAGGDDVLAILPQPFALDCARDVQQFYSQCFAKVNAQLKGREIITSISAGINFAHYKTPLTQVLFDAHELLDDVAKEDTGRNSLAVRVWKPGGLHAQWSAPWSQLEDLQQISATVATHLQGDLSRSFFFKLENLIESLQLEKEDHQFDEPQIAALVRAAWTHTGNKLEGLPSGMEMQLLEACRKVKRELHPDGSERIHKCKNFVPGALKLIQFLATENQQFISTGKAQGEQE